MNQIQCTRPRSGVSKEVVSALHDLAQALSAAIPEFSGEPVAKALLRDSLQGILDVAIVHDAIGGYGIYPEFGRNDEEIRDELLGGTA